MQITVHLDPDAAAALRGAPAEDDAAADVRRAEEALGIELVPLDADGGARLLATIFHVFVPHPEAAARVAERLRGTRGVESAYLKPQSMLA